MASGEFAILFLRISSYYVQQQLHDNYQSCCCSAKNEKKSELFASEIQTKTSESIRNLCNESPRFSFLWFELNVTSNVRQRVIQTEITKKRKFLDENEANCS